ncbi:MAG: BatD family protein, partial [Acidobacteriota bacterium]
MAFLTVLLPVVGRAATVRAEVQPSRIRADGTVLFKVIVEADALDGVTAPPLGNLKDWRVVNGPSISTQFTYINGRSISSRTFSWVLAPVGPGKRILPALPVEVAGRRLLTDPLEVEVQPAVGTPSPMIQGTPSLPGRGGHPESGSPDVFVRAVVSDAGPFVGQRVELSYLLYTRVEVASIPQLQDVPAYPDFWTEDVATPPHVTARVERVNGVEYRVYTIRTVALFPTSSGTVTLQPATFSVPVKSRGRSGFRRSFFFEPVETVYCRTLPLTLHVRPLPAEGRPANFSNAVGDFNLKVDVDRKEGRTGEALALTATVSGTGNLRSVDPPMVEPTGEFTVYPPRQEDAEASSGEASRTSRKWEYVMVPRRPGSQELPTLRFSYFDP